MPRARSTAYGRIRELGLEGNAVELETKGLTILPPDPVDDLGSDRRELAERMHDSLLRIEEANGVVETLADGVTVVHDLLFQHPVFEEAVLHPAVLAFADAYLGKDCRLRLCGPSIRGRDSSRSGTSFGLHADRYSSTNQELTSLNAVWLLTEYSREHGTLCFVPGSHRSDRKPQDEDVDELVTVEAPAGSVLMFPESLWHGTHPRSSPGRRLAVHCLYVPADSKFSRVYADRVRAELLAQKSSRLRLLLGLHEKTGGGT